MFKMNTNNIIKLRQKLNISQEELAERLEISRSALSRYENGANIPSNILIMLATELDASIDYLLGLDHSISKEYETLWKDFALDDESIDKIKLIANQSKDRNSVLAIDTINYLFKYSNIELIEYIGEYLNIPLPNKVDYKIGTKLTIEQKREMNEQRKYEVEKFIVLQEISKLFDQIKSSKEVKEKYKKFKKHIEGIDRPISKATNKQLHRLGIE